MKGNILEETYARPMHWQIIDEITYADGRTETRKYENLVVNGCSRLIATLMASAVGYKGLQYWAVGKGDSTWINEKLPSPVVTNQALVKETYRKAIPVGNIAFIDENNNTTASITNRLQVTLTFDESEANGELREFGLFGGNATATAGSGIMINHKIHPVIYKTTGMKLARTIRITF